MQTSKKIFHITSLVILPLTLLLTGVLLPIIITLTSAENVKKSLSDSGAYDIFLSEALTKQTFIRQVIAAEPKFEDKLVGTVRPYLEGPMSEGIESFYDWMAGRAATVEFELDFGPAREEVSELFRDQTLASMQALRECGPDEQLPNTKRSPYLWRCFPAAQTSPQEVADTLYNEIYNDDELWGEDVVVGLEDLTGISERELMDEYAVIATTYQAIVVGAWVLAILTILASLGVIFLAPALYRGLRRFGVNAVVIGVLLLAVAVAGSMLTALLLEDFSTTDPMDIVSHALLTSISNAIITGWWWFTSVIGGLGITAIIAAVVMKKRQVNQVEPPVDTTPPTTPQV